MNTESTCECSAPVTTGNAEVTRSEELRTIRPEWHSRDNGEEVALLVALPGVLKQDLEVSARENQVRLRATRSLPGFPGVAYELSLRLSRDLDPASAKASLRDGILDLRFGRREEAKPRRIEVNG